MTNDKQLRFHTNFGEIEFTYAHDNEALEESWRVANYYNDRVATVIRAFGKNQQYAVRFDNRRDYIPSLWFYGEAEAIKTAIEFAISS